MFCRRIYNNKRGMRCYQPVGHLRDHTDVEERRIAVWLHKPMHHHLQRNIVRIMLFSYLSGTISSHFWKKTKFCCRQLWIIVWWWWAPNGVDIVVTRCLTGVHIIARMMLLMVYWDWFGVEPIVLIILKAETRFLQLSQPGTALLLQLLQTSKPL